MMEEPDPFLRKTNEKRYKKASILKISPKIASGYVLEVL
jgi:hypothetical protein